MVAGIAALICIVTQMQRNRFAEAISKAILIEAVFEKHCPFELDAYDNLTFFSLGKNGNGNWNTPDERLLMHLENFRTVEECDNFFVCKSSKEPGLLYYVEFLEWDPKKGVAKINFGFKTELVECGARCATYLLLDGFWVESNGGDYWVS